MTDKKNKPDYQITWPEGAELKMDPKHLMEIRNSLETQFKLMIYKQPGFKFFPSLGNTNFFQHFRTNDGIDFGVCHLYWDKDATDNIDFIDENGKVEERRGGWRVRWLPKGCYEVVGDPSPISTEGYKKVAKAMAERVAQTAVSKIKAAVEQKIPDINREIDKWESEEDNDEDKPKYLNQLGELLIKVTTEEDYILYEVVCDYCDKEYEITLQTEKLPKQVIECCPFCGNLIEEPAESVDEQNSWS